MAAENISIAFGRHLKNIRIQLGLNQDDVAAACGIDPTSISRLERGETNATLMTMSRLAKGLCIPLRDLLDFNQEYQVFESDEELVTELRTQLRRLTPEEQQFVLECVRNFAALKKRS